LLPQHCLCVLFIILIDGLLGSRPGYTIRWFCSSQTQTAGVHAAGQSVVWSDELARDTGGRADVAHELAPACAHGPMDPTHASETRLA
jgi:hypothetical protein